MSATDPHLVLGRHEADGNKVVRALRPSASDMRVFVPDGGRVDMERVHEGDLSSAAVPGATDGYRLEVDYPAGVTLAFDDPYRF